MNKETWRENKKTIIFTIIIFILIEFILPIYLVIGLGQEAKEREKKWSKMCHEFH